MSKKVVDLSDTLALHLQRLHLGEIMVVCDDIRDDRLLIGMVYADICREDSVLSYFTRRYGDAEAVRAGRLLPSGSRSLVIPRCCSARLKAFCRLW